METASTKHIEILMSESLHAWQHFLEPGQPSIAVLPIAGAAALSSAPKGRQAPVLAQAVEKPVDVGLICYLMRGMRSARWLF